MTKLPHLFVLSALGLAAGGCVIAVERPAPDRGADSDRPPVERRFDVASFAAIELAGPDRVQVTTGPVAAVVASGDPRAIDALDIAVRGDTLRIARSPGSHRDRGALVRVTVPALRAASLTGSGAIGIGPVAVPAFAASLAGSGAMRVDGLRTRTVRFDLSGSGSIIASGQADEVAVDLGGSGSVDTSALVTPALTVSAGGSGTVGATASRVATIRAGGSGSVRVTGGARCDVTRGGSGTVRCG